MAKKKKRTPGMVPTGPTASPTPAAETAAPRAAAPTAAPAGPAPEPEVYTEVDLSLSWRWHVTTILAITLITLALFGFYKWAIRYWADDKLVVARAYFEQAKEIKPDFFRQEDGYTPIAKDIESVMVDGVNFQSFLVEVQKKVNAEAITAVPEAQRPAIAAFKQRLLHLGVEVFENPPYTIEPVLQNQIDHCRLTIKSTVEMLTKLETASFDNSDALADELWAVHLKLVTLTEQMRAVRGIFDYMAALDMAIEQARRAVGSDNAYPAAFHLLAQALEEQGLLEDAADQYLAVVEIDPSTELAAGIIAKYEALAKDAPQDLTAHFTLGRIYRALGRRAEAESEIRKAIELDIALKPGATEETPNTYTGYLARQVLREILTNTRNEQYPGREG